MGRRLKKPAFFSPVCRSGLIRGSEGLFALRSSPQIPSCSQPPQIHSGICSEAPPLKTKSGALPPNPAPLTTRRSSSPEAAHGCPTPPRSPLNALVRALARGTCALSVPANKGARGGLSMQPESGAAIAALPLARGAQIHIKMLYVCGLSVRR